MYVRGVLAHPPTACAGRVCASRNGSDALPAQRARDGSASSGLEGLLKHNDTTIHHHRATLLAHTIGSQGVSGTARPPDCASWPHLDARSISGVRLHKALALLGGGGFGFTRSANLFEQLASSSSLRRRVCTCSVRVVARRVREVGHADALPRYRTYSTRASCVDAIEPHGPRRLTRLFYRALRVFAQRRFSRTRASRCSKRARIRGSRGGRGCAKPS